MCDCVKNLVETNVIKLEGGLYFVFICENCKRRYIRQPKKWVGVAYNYCTEEWRITDDVILLKDFNRLEIIGILDSALHFLYGTLPEFDLVTDNLKDVIQQLGEEWNVKLT